MTDGSKFQVLSFNGAGAELHSVKKRKFHQKVTSGCLACRKKKVKCDELKPVCLRCSRNRRLCQYGRQEERDKNVVERTQQPSPSYLSAITLLPFSASSPPDGTSTINLIQYLWQNWTNITNVDCRPETKDLFKSDPTVRAVMLALTATHIRQQVPAHRPHRITELFHRSLALEKYREQLQALKRVPDQKGVNSLFISATFLNLLTFAHHESEALPAQKIMDPESSWLFSPREDRLNWLVLQTGLRPLMLSMNEYFTEGVKFTSMIFTGKYTDRWTFAHLIESLEGVPGHWIEFFGLVSSTRGCECNGLGDAYRAPATILATVGHLELNRYNLFRNLLFLGKLQGDFHSLVYQRDERALWLFGYWLAIILRYGLWWCESRAKQDLEAIWKWLRMRRLIHRPGREGELWTIMMEELECMKKLSLF
uniref:Zn(2)-C6 fungal-type domain-containing protein n=1 Tax=Bionectria ochroleuca TaxID=29856 RepID=A0A0B7K7T8_BIOOC